MMFLLDSSRRASKSFNSLVDFLEAVIRKFPFGMNQTRVGVSTFSDRPYVEAYLNGHKSRDGLFDAMSSMETTTGAANYYIALWMLYSELYTRSRGDRDDAANVALMVTDTAPDDAVVSALRNSMISMGQTVKDEGIGLYVIAIGPLVDLELLKEICGDKNNVFYVENYDVLLSANTIEHVVYRIRRLGKTRIKQDQRIRFTNILEDSQRL